MTLPPYQSIRQTVKSTGCSEYFLRKGLKTGAIPHIRTGTKYLINVPALLELLERSSWQNCDNV